MLFNVCILVGYYILKNVLFFLVFTNNTVVRKTLFEIQHINKKTKDNIIMLMFTINKRTNILRVKMLCSSCLLQQILFSI